MPQRTAQKPPTSSRWWSPRLHAWLHGTLGVIGLMTAARLIYPKALRIVAADPTVFGRGLVANLALVFGSLMFLRNARFFSRRAAESAEPRRSTEES